MRQNRIEIQWPFVKTARRMKKEIIKETNLSSAQWAMANLNEAKAIISLLESIEMFQSDLHK